MGGLSQPGATSRSRVTWPALPSPVSARSQAMQPRVPGSRGLPAVTHGPPAMLTTQQVEVCARLPGGILT